MKSDIFGICFFYLLWLFPFCTTWFSVQYPCAVNVLVFPDIFLCLPSDSSIISGGCLCHIIWMCIEKHSNPPASHWRYPLVRQTETFTSCGIYQCILCGTPWTYFLFSSSFVDTWLVRLYKSPWFSTVVFFIYVRTSTSFLFAEYPDTPSFFVAKFLS